MTLQQLLARWRQLIDDTAEPYLVSQDIGKALLNEAVDEACKRGRLLRASATQALTAATATYTLPEGWFELARVAHSGTDEPPMIASLDVVREEYPRWATDTGELVRAVIVDLDTNSYTVTPIPSAAATLTLYGYRVPTAAQRMSATSDVPTGIHPSLHIHLCHWAAHVSYMTRDADAGDLQRSTFHGQQFETYFGPPVSANSLRIRQQVRGQRVKACW